MTEQQLADLEQAAAAIAAQPDVDLVLYGPDTTPRMCLTGCGQPALYSRALCLECELAELNWLLGQQDEAYEIVVVTAQVVNYGTHWLLAWAVRIALSLHTHLPPTPSLEFNPRGLAQYMQPERFED